MTRVFEGDVWVAYGQAYVLDGPDGPSDLNECFAGQTNGLCGAARPGVLFLMTGLHTGHVPIAVDVLDAPPPDGGEGGEDDDPEPTDQPTRKPTGERLVGWEDVVEVSFVVTATRTDPNRGWCPCDGVGADDLVEVVLGGWGGLSVTVIPLPTAGDYRVRYSITGMDAGHAQDNNARGEPITEHHLLQLWPAPPAPDAVLRQTSENAAYWHAHARSLPPPPTPEQRAEAARVAEQQAQREQAARAEAHEIAWRWGGRAPSRRLREVADVAATMARVDRDLLDQVAELDPITQRGAARWLAHRAYRHAGLDAVDWARAGLDALDHDQPLPPPFPANGHTGDPTADGDLTEAFTLAVALDPWPGWTPRATPLPESTEHTAAFLTVEPLAAPPPARSQPPSPRPASPPPPTGRNLPRSTRPRPAPSSTPEAVGEVVSADPPPADADAAKGPPTRDGPDRSARGHRRRPAARPARHLPPRSRHLRRRRDPRRRAPRPPWPHRHDITRSYRTRTTTAVVNS